MKNVLDEILKEAFSGKPLYHFTTIGGLRNICETGYIMLSPSNLSGWEKEASKDSFFLSYTTQSDFTGNYVNKKNTEADRDLQSYRCVRLTFDVEELQKHYEGDPVDRLKGLTVEKIKQLPKSFQTYLQSIGVDGTGSPEDIEAKERAAEHEERQHSTVPFLGDVDTFITDVLIQYPKLRYMPQTEIAFYRAIKAVRAKDSYIAPEKIGLQVGGKVLRNKELDEYVNMNLSRRSGGMTAASAKQNKTFNDLLSKGEDDIYTLSEQEWNNLIELTARVFADEKDIVVSRILRSAFAQVDFKKHGNESLDTFIDKVIDVSHNVSNDDLTKVKYLNNRLVRDRLTGVKGRIYAAFQQAVFEYTSYLNKEHGLSLEPFCSNISDYKLSLRKGTVLESISFKNKRVQSLFEKLLIL